MSCDEVRELLPEHLLGVLEPDPERAVSRHLRGCGACRAELASLGQGLATFARAAHQSDPPETLRDRVLAVLEEEQAEAPAVVPLRRRFTGSLLAQAALVVALAGALAWGTVATVAGSHASDRAGRYQAFLSALGGASTSRVLNLARIAAATGPETLVLLDEPGAGTDPVEGAALAVGLLTVLLEHMRKNLERAWSSNDNGQ